MRSGERKLITALFVDVEGSMGISGQLTVDAWAELMDELLSVIRTSVEHFGGLIKFTGDGALVLFGAKLAEEDHARHGCLAALQLRGVLERVGDAMTREHGAGIRVRMGVNSGEVIATHLDGSDSQEVLGHAVALAQRMQTCAAAGEICVSEFTAALLRDEFELEPAGHLEVQGNRVPIRTFTLRGLRRSRSWLASARARGLADFVGRDRELAELSAAFERALTGDGQVVGLVGDPGVGKSRLCAEFLDSCEQQGVTVRRTTITPLGRVHPLGAALDMLRRRFDLSAEDSAADAWDKVHSGLAGLSEDLAARAPWLCDFLGIHQPGHALAAVDPDVRRQRIVDIVAEMVRCRSAQEPVVELIEDVHWMDDASLPFLVGLIAAVAGTRTLLVLNFRSGYDSSWLGAPHTHELRVESLDPVASELLVQGLVGADPSVMAISKQVETRSEGNPFFAEELLRNLVEVGTVGGTAGHYRALGNVVPAALPLTVQSILSARIDRLSGADKKVLQTAAVLGREFEASMLAQVLQVEQETLAPALAALATAALVDPVGGQRRAFRHGLTHEVAYGSLLSGDRVELHARIAEELISGPSEVLDERASLIGHHLSAAGDVVAAAAWFKRAAVWVGRNHPATALGYWREVSSLTARAKHPADTTALALEARMRTLSLLWRLGASGPELAADFVAGRALAQAAGSLTAESLIVANYATVLGFAGNNRERLDLAFEAVELAERSGDLGVLQTARAALALGLSHAGRLEDNRTLLTQFLSDAHKHPEAGAGLALKSPLSWGHYMRGCALFWTGGPLSDTQAAYGEALRQARIAGDTEVECWTHAYLTRVLMTHDQPRAISHAAKAVELAQAAGDGLSLTVAYLALAFLRHRQGDMDAAEDAVVAVLSVVDQHHAGAIFAPIALALLSDIALASGAREAARDHAVEGIRRARTYGHRMYEIPAHLALARVLRTAADDAGAGRELDLADELIRATGALAFQDELITERATLLTASTVCR